MNKTRIFIILLFALVIVSHFKKNIQIILYEQIEKFITNNYYGLDHEKINMKLKKY